MCYGCGSLPEQVCVGVRVAVRQVHHIIVMWQREGEGQGVLWAALPIACAALVIPHLTPSSQPTPALAAAHQCHMHCNHSVQSAPIKHKSKVQSRISVSSINRSGKLKQQKRKKVNERLVVLGRLMSCHSIQTCV